MFFLFFIAEKRLNAIFQMRKRKDTEKNTLHLCVYKTNTNQNFQIMPKFTLPPFSQNPKPLSVCVTEEFEYEGS